MKKVFLMAMAMTVSMVFGQGAPQRTNRRSLDVPRMSNDERAFLELYPAGTNAYNRTYSQQKEFESSFAPDRFLGFVFGNVYERYGEKQSLKTPFRLFDTITLYRSDLNRLCLIKMQKDVEKITLESAKRELDRIANLLKREYQIEFRHWPSDGSYHFDDLNAEIDLDCFVINGRASALFLSVRNKKVSREDAERKLSEDAKDFKDIDIPEDVGTSELSAAESEVLTQPLTADEEKEDQLRLLQANQEYWEGWPRSVREGNSNYVAAVKAVEKQFKVALVDMTGAPKWMVGEGRSCIRYCANDGDYYEKYDAEGRLVKISGNRSDFAEMKAVDEKREELLKSEREAWAKAKGISYEDAMSRSNEWQNVGLIGGRLRLGGLQRPGGSGTGLLGGSLRARRLRRQQQEAAAAAAIREELAVKNAERQALAEQEKAQRAAERAEQRQQLLAIQEEVKRVREAKSAAKTEAIE